jgi:hypothetical protein
VRKSFDKVKPGITPGNLQRLRLTATANAFDQIGIIHKAQDAEGMVFSYF